MTETGRPLALVLGACAILLAGCQARPSPAQPILSADTVEIGEPDHQIISVETTSDSPVLVTVTGRDVDVRAAIFTADGATGPFADAPNRRMGIETLLIESPHAAPFSIRIERNDQREARGSVTVDVVALPSMTEADQRRLEAVRLEAKAGLLFGDLGKGEETAGAYESAADLYRQNDDERSEGIALLHAAGARYTRLGDWQGAADLARRAGSALNDVDAPGFAAFALRVQGAALDQMADSIDETGDSGEIAVSAREKLGEAARGFLKLGMHYEAGFALNYRGVSYLNAGDHGAAQADFEEALDQFITARDGPAQALSLQSLALISHEDGRLTDAMREFDAALALIPRDTDAANYAHTLHNSALPLRVLGRFDEAIARYYEAGQILRGLGDRDGEARALHGMGTALRHAGEPERARELLRAAIELRKNTGARREQAISLIVLGEIERDDGNLDAAIAIHRQAAALVSAPQDRAKATLALVQDQIAVRDLAAAHRGLDEILQMDLPKTHRYLGMALTELGIVESLEGNAPAAADAFGRALTVHQSNGSELEQARVLYRRAEAGMRSGNTLVVLADTAAALKLFDDVGLQGTQAENRASFRATYRRVVELRIAAYLANAEAAARQGNLDRSQELLRTALAASDLSRAQLLTSAGTSGMNADGSSPELLAQRREAYELLAGKRQQQDRLLEAAAPDTARLKSLGVEISLLRAKAALIESRIAKTRTAAPLAASADDWLPPAGAGFIVAEFFLGDQHSWLFEVRDRVVAVHALVDHSELEELTRQLHVAWQSPIRAPGDRLASSRGLSRSVFGGLQSPDPGTTLLIIPDGALHLAPMALLAQQAWPRLQPGAAIVVPSLHARRLDRPGVDARARKTLAVIADPIYAANDTRIRLAARQPSVMNDALLTRSGRDLGSLQRLPATAVEARELMALVGKSSETLALIGADASRERVTKAPLDEYRIVHFATHALADSQDPALATLALSQWDESGRATDGALRLYDISQLHLNADLVVLSGCDTTLGLEIAGEAPISLSQAFLRIGAVSVVSTLWQVPDTSTAALMREFYRQLLTRKRGAPVALQLAQDYVRAQPRWSDPYYWAGFQLVSMAPNVRNDNVE